MSFLKCFWRHLVCLSVVGVLGLSSARAQDGFYLHELAISGELMDQHYEVYNYLINPGDQLALDTLGQILGEDADTGFEVVNTGQAGSGVFGADREELPFFGGNDYAIEARAEVTIPAGTWSIGFGTDDGGQLTLQTKSGSDIAFSSTFGTNGVGDYRLRGQPSNQIWFLGNRGHAWTGGTFTVTEPTTAIFHSSFHERGGGDNFEVAIFQGTSTAVANNTWQLLSDGTLGWNVQATEELPALQANGLPKGPGGPSLGGVNDGIQQAIVPTAGVVFNTVGDGTTTTANGLQMRWTPWNNAGNLIANLNGMAAGIGGADTLVFHGSPQWIGNAGAGLSGLEDIVKYPDEVVDAGGAWAGAAGGNQESYQVWSSGQINLPAGQTKLRLGIDDYKYLAIDTGGNGVAGDQPGEVLLDDNQWLDPYAGRGATDSNVNVFTGVEVAEAGWYNIEVIMNEGGGGDSQTIFWDANGNADEFPNIKTLNYDEVASDFLVPDDKFRAVTRGDLDPDNPFSLKAAFEGASVNLDISSDLVDADHVVLKNANLSTTIDLAGATININAMDDLVAGDAFVLFVSDSVTGAADATWNYPTDAADWTNQLVAGTGNRIIYKGGGGVVAGDCNGDGLVDAADLACTCPSKEALAVLGLLEGDLDGDGSVGFPDFLALSANFGQNVSGYNQGDIDCNGSVGFPDFLALSANFGQSAGGAAAAAVPEPSSVALLGLGALLMGVVRRRRS